MLVGTEDGKDYTASILAFGHGVATPVIIDSDMDGNKQSPYYLGSYFSMFGIPSFYSKPVPLKKDIEYIHFNPKFNVPLFQLVYNDSVIVSAHWGNATFKFIPEIQNNLIKTFLYDYPPMLHLDRAALQKYRSVLKDYLPLWSKWHRRLVQTEMIDFQFLSPDRLLQKTSFSDGIQIIANFSDHSYRYQQCSIPSKSLIIVKGTEELDKFSTQFLSKLSLK